MSQAATLREFMDKYKGQLLSIIKKRNAINEFQNLSIDEQNKFDFESYKSIENESLKWELISRVCIYGSNKFEQLQNYTKSYFFDKFNATEQNNSNSNSFEYYINEYANYAKEATLIVDFPSRLLFFECIGLKLFKNNNKIDMDKNGAEKFCQINNEDLNKENVEKVTNKTDYIYYRKEHIKQEIDIFYNPNYSSVNNNYIRFVPFFECLTELNNQIEPDSFKSDIFLQDNDLKSRLIEQDNLDSLTLWKNAFKIALFCTSEAFKESLKQGGPLFTIFCGIPTCIVIFFVMPFVAYFSNKEKNKKFESIKENLNQIPPTDNLGDDKLPESQILKNQDPRPKMEINFKIEKQNL